GRNEQQAGRAALSSHRPLRGRLRRRHAAHGIAVHVGGGAARQRHLDAARLPRRDPRARGLAPGRLRLPAHFADHDILTPGDAPNVLVAMNPAALKTNIGDLPKGGTLIVDADAFTDRNLSKAGYAESPLEDGSLDEFQLHAIPLTSLTVGALKDVEGVTPREAERSKNMF